MTKYRKRFKHYSLLLSALLYCIAEHCEAHIQYFEIYIQKNPFGLDEVSEISCKLYSYISLLPSYKEVSMILRLGYLFCQVLFMKPPHLLNGLLFAFKIDFTNTFYNVDYFSIINTACTYTYL